MVFKKVNRMLVKGPFLVVSSCQANEKTQRIMMEISPDVMFFGGGKWLVALGSVVSYWRGVSQDDLPQTIRKILDENFNEQPLASIGQASHYRATIANGPWRALLIANLMEERSITGLIQETSGVWRNLSQLVKWSDIWSLGHEVRKHLIDQDKKQNVAKNLLKTLNLMEKSFLNIGVHSPNKLSNIPKDQIWRRFSDWGLRIWEWTWDSGTGFGNNDHFPWKQHIEKEIFFVERQLDDEIKDWAHIEDALRKDLNLLASACSENICITQMDWLINLDNGLSYVVPVVFRCPMDLKKDLPEGKSFLKYIFHNFWGNLNLMGQKNLEVLGIKSWRLEVKKYLLSRREAQSLFRDADFSFEVLSLEGRLSTPLIRYKLTKDPWPEFSYAMAEVGEKKFLDNQMYPSMDRPLFVWKHPIPAKEPPDKFFLERVSLRWWEKGNFGRRDYYRTLDQEGQVHWVFKDQNGFWYQHGIFA